MRNQTLNAEDQFPNFERLAAINELIELSGSEGIFCKAVSRILGPHIGPSELLDISEEAFELLRKNFRGTLDKVYRNIF